MPRWDRELAGRLISRWRVTHWTNIPTMVIDLLGSPNFDQYDLSSLVYIGGGGAAMPQAVAQRLFEQFGLRYVEGYGLTETAAPVHSNPPDAPKQQCLGIPFMGTDARVIDPDTLQEMPHGRAGRNHHPRPRGVPGLLEAARRHGGGVHRIRWQTVLPLRRSGPGGRGRLFLHDRPAQTHDQRQSGFKVWPAEVEALMFRHPAIQEACIISTKDSLPRRVGQGRRGAARHPQGQVSEQDIIDWCRENMAVYKVPRVVQFVDALPKSGSGKVMWRALQEAEPRS